MGRVAGLELAAAGQGRDGCGFMEKKLRRSQMEDRQKTIRAGGEWRSWMRLNLLHDLWEGGSVEGREPP